MEECLYANIFDIYTGEVKVQKVVKSGQIKDSDRLFNSIAVDICDKYLEIGIELGLKGRVLTNELETGSFAMLPGNKKAIKMLQLWQQSVKEDDFTYSVLGTALEKHGFQQCADIYCYASSIICTGNDMDNIIILLKFFSAHPDGKLCPSEKTHGI